MSQNRFVGKYLAGMGAIPVPTAGSITLWGPWAFCFGIAFWFAPEKEPVFWIAPILFLGTLLTLLFHIRFHPTRISKLFFLVMATAFLFGVCLAELRSYNKAAPVMPNGTKSWMVTGKLHRVDRERGHRARYLVKVTNIEDIEAKKTPEFVRVGGLRGDAKIGDMVRFRATLERPKSAILPGGFSFARNAWFTQIGGTGFTWGHLEVLNSSTSISWQLYVTQFRYRLANTIREKIPGTSGGVAAALITGDRSGIPEDLATAYREAGLGHLLAISGLHMSLVGGLVFIAMSNLFSMIPAIGARMDARKPAAITGIVVSLGYLLISGAAVPTQRAFIMMTLIFVAVLLGRRALSIRTISVAAFLVAFISPEYVVSPGFQMSFAASLALVAFYQYAGRWFSNPSIGKMIDGPFFLYMRKIGIFFIGILLTSLIAGLATAPFAAFHFHKIAVYSLLGNLLAMPIFTLLVMPSLFAGVCLMPLGLEGPFFAISAYGLDLIGQISIMTSNLHGAVIGVQIAPKITLFFEALALVFLCLNFSKLKYVSAILIGMSLIFHLQILQPVLWIGEKGGALLMQSDGSREIYTFGKPNNFSLRQFKEAVGLPKVIPQPIQKWSGANCDFNGCTLRIADRFLSLPTTHEDIETDCQFAHMVILLGALQPRQAAACSQTEVYILKKDKGTMFYRNHNHWIKRKSAQNRIWDSAGK